QAPPPKAKLLGKRVAFVDIRPPDFMDKEVRLQQVRIRRLTEPMSQHDRDAWLRAGVPSLLLGMEGGGTGVRYVHGDAFNLGVLLGGSDESAKLAIQVLEAALLANTVHENDTNPVVVRPNRAILRPWWRPILRVLRRRVDRR